MEEPWFERGRGEERTGRGVERRGEERREEERREEERFVTIERHDIAAYDRTIVQDRTGWRYRGYYSLFSIHVQYSICTIGNEGLEVGW